jgi:hypothetical protein
MLVQLNETYSLMYNIKIWAKDFECSLQKARVLPFLANNSSPCPLPMMRPMKPLFMMG